MLAFKVSRVQQCVRKDVILFRPSFLQRFCTIAFILASKFSSSAVHDIWPLASLLSLPKCSPCLRHLICEIFESFHLYYFQKFQLVSSIFNPKKLRIFQRFELKHFELLMRFWLFLLFAKKNLNFFIYFKELFWLISFAITWNVFGQRQKLGAMSSAMKIWLRCLYHS